MPDARFTYPTNYRLVRATSSTSAGEVWQLPGGLAAFQDNNAPANAGDVPFKTDGLCVVTKTSSVVILDGGEVYWDHSANSATFRKVNDRDFYIGRAVGDAQSLDANMVVDLNKNPRYDIDAFRDGGLSVPIGTQAVGAFGHIKDFGGSKSLELTSTSEAQKIDLLSVDRFDKTANAIIEMVIRAPANGSTSDVDFNIGVANGTDATNADSITESIFFHIDGGALLINAESDDGTTEVNATDTTTTITAGSALANRKHLWIDMRDPTDCQLYVDGVLVLPSTVFNVNAATGPFGLLVHLEKVSGAATGQYVVDRFTARYSEQ